MTTVTDIVLGSFFPLSSPADPQLMEVASDVEERKRR
jgi:hypothetical protein